MMHRKIGRKISGMLLACCILLVGIFQGGSSNPMKTYAAENKSREIAIGSVVSFGSYEQDNNLENGKEPLEWIVLDRKEGSVLLLSRYVIDCEPYHEERTDITWADCDLRFWLNGEFYGDAFNVNEQDRIMQTEVVNHDNESYDVPGGFTTYDKIFLLSLEEIGRYTGTNPERKAKATPYAKELGVYTYDEDAYWWLRSPGNGTSYAAYVSNKFGVNDFGRSVNYAYVGVRPALWVTLD
ncbi:MAG: DUF6273 domain-containing protein [Lachnospiraceae bacterium]|nr:DUF6273 domain-containing protein [Lachnospiraceae bacterium]